MIDPVGLEHRLTTMEGTISDGFETVIGRLDVLNGKVAKHEEWINDRKLEARELKGFMEGRAALRKKDLAILSSIIGVLVTVLQAAPHVLGALR